MSTTVAAQSLQLKALTPILTVSDIEASLAWYRDVLGCSIAEEMRHDGELQGARLQIGAVELILGRDDFKKGRDRGKGEGFRLYCTVDGDVDEMAAEIKARGGTLAHEPTDQPWGARDFGIEDPDGFKISISSGM